MKSDAWVFGNVWELLDFQNGRQEMAQMPICLLNTMILRCDHLC